MKRLLRTIMMTLACVMLSAQPMYATPDNRGRGRHGGAPAANSGSSRHPGAGGARNGRIQNAQRRPGPNTVTPPKPEGRPAGIGRPGVSGRPGNQPGNNRPGNRPGNGPGNQRPDNRPGNNRPGNRPGGHKPYNRPGNNRPGTHRPDNRPGDRPGGHRPDYGHRPGGSGHGYGHVPPPPRPWHRPTPPPRWRPPHGTPSVATFLGITFGTALAATLNQLAAGNVVVAAYNNSTILLNNVTMYNVLWPEARMLYNNGVLYGSQFIYPSSYYNPAYYDMAYTNLLNTYGYPVSCTQLTNGYSATWFGGNGGFITLSLQPAIGGDGRTHYYTTLSIGN